MHDLLYLSIIIDHIPIERNMWVPIDNYIYDLQVNWLKTNAFFFTNPLSFIHHRPPTKKPNPYHDHLLTYSNSISDILRQMST